MHAVARLTRPLMEKTSGNDEYEHYSVRFFFRVGGKGLVSPGSICALSVGSV